MLLTPSRKLASNVMPYFMMKLLLTFLIILTPNFLYCQTDTTRVENTIVFIGGIEKMPEFIGGNESLRKYTNQASKDGIEGIVYISFWIERDGTVSNTKVIRGLRQDLDSIGLNLIQNMSNWIPATQRGNPIRISYILPIKFRPDWKTALEEPKPSWYWKKRGKRKFEIVCKETYRKSQDECDCWYRFIIWNYYGLKIQDIDIKEMFEKQRCDNK
jgi:TonB family protein